MPTLKEQLASLARKTKPVEVEGLEDPLYVRELGYAEYTAWTSEQPDAESAPEAFVAWHTLFLGLTLSEADGTPVYEDGPEDDGLDALTNLPTAVFAELIDAARAINGLPTFSELASYEQPAEGEQGGDPSTSGDSFADSPESSEFPPGN